jgi:hypothetical protein
MAPDSDLLRAIGNRPPPHCRDAPRGTPWGVSSKRQTCHFRPWSEGQRRVGREIGPTTTGADREGETPLQPSAAVPPLHPHNDCADQEGGTLRSRSRSDQGSCGPGDSRSSKGLGRLRGPALRRRRPTGFPVGVSTVGGKHAGHRAAVRAFPLRRGFLGGAEGFEDLTDWRQELLVRLQACLLGTEEVGLGHNYHPRSEGGRQTEKEG